MIVCAQVQQGPVIQLKLTPSPSFQVGFLQQCLVANSGPHAHASGIDP